jgi:predicted transcriptional regulator
MTVYNTAVSLAAMLILATPSGHASELSQRNLPRLAVDARGELLLDERGAVRYQRWELHPLHASAHVGVLMLLPARLSSRKEIAPLEQAMSARGYDYRRLSSTSIVNLSDATWGATLMVEGELRAEKKAEPDVRLVVDEKGEALHALDLRKGVIHVLLYGCAGGVLQHHQGAFTGDQAQAFVARIDSALRGPSCAAVQPGRTKE